MWDNPPIYNKVLSEACAWNTTFSSMFCNISKGIVSSILWVWRASSYVYFWYYYTFHGITFSLTEVFSTSTIIGSILSSDCKECFRTVLCSRRANRTHWSDALEDQFLDLINLKKEHQKRQALIQVVDWFMKDRE